MFVLEQAGPAQHHVTVGKEQLNTVPLGFFSQCPGLYVVSHWVIGKASPESKGTRHRQQCSTLSLLIIGQLFVSVSSIFSFCLSTNGRMCLNTDVLCWRDFSLRKAATKLLLKYISRLVHICGAHGASCIPYGRLLWLWKVNPDVCVFVGDCDTEDTEGATRDDHTLVSASVVGDSRCQGDSWGFHFPLAWPLPQVHHHWFKQMRAKRQEWHCVAVSCGSSPDRGCPVQNTGSHSFSGDTFMSQFQGAPLDLKKCTDIGISPLPPPSRNQWLLSHNPLRVHCLCQSFKIVNLTDQEDGFFQVCSVSKADVWSRWLLWGCLCPAACWVTLPRRCQELSPPSYDQQHLQADWMTLALTKLLSFGPLS